VFWTWADGQGLEFVSENQAAPMDAASCAFAALSADFRANPAHSATQAPKGYDVCEILAEMRALEHRLGASRFRFSAEEFDGSGDDDLDKALRVVHDHISSITADGFHFYTGISSNLNYRFFVHEELKDYAMTVLIMSDSIFFIRQLEKACTARFCSHPLVENKRHGGGGNLQRKPYFLYVNHRYI